MTRRASNGARVFAGFLVLILGACAERGPIREAEVRSPQLPGAVPSLAIPVGGGYRIDFIAPEDGIVFLCAERVGSIILTKSLRQGEEIRIESSGFSVRPAVDASAETARPVEPEEADLVDLSGAGAISVTERVLYFLPNSLWVEPRAEGKTGGDG